VFDDGRVGAAGGELSFMSRGYDAATDRYEIAFTGGANSVDERWYGHGGSAL
jgi:hypothetical protein